MQPTDEEGIPHTTGDVPGEMIINLVTKAVTAISNRLNALTTVDGADSKVSTMTTLICTAFIVTFILCHFKMLLKWNKRNFENFLECDFRFSK